MKYDPILLVIQFQYPDRQQNEFLCFNYSNPEETRIPFKQRKWEFNREK